MNEAIIKVSHLAMDDVIHRRGEVVELTDEQMTMLAPFVERVIPTVEVIDNRDAKITELEATVKTISGTNDAKDREITKLKKEISSRQREIQKLLKEK